jgi:acyl carrier protein
MTLPIGGADMPVVISLYNALTGLAVAFEGFVLQNAAMIIAGTVVGAAGSLLTQLMAKAMNRSLANVLFSGFGDTAAASGPVEGSMKAIESSDAGVMLAFANKVLIVPGYGMAVAQAQHKVWELAQLLRERGVDVKFASHPVAGRMPGHMNATPPGLSSAGRSRPAATLRAMADWSLDALTLEVHEILRDEILCAANGFSPQSNLIEAGLDSLAVTQLLLSIEERTGVWVDESLLTPENLESSVTLATLVYEQLRSP